MSTTRAERIPRSGPAVALLVAALLLTGCGGETSERSAEPSTPAGAAGPGGSAAPSGTASAGASDPAVPDPLAGATTAPDVVAGVTRVLERRATAVVAGDEAAFRAGVLARDPDFRAQQEEYYDNLRQLPLQVYSLTPDPATLVRDDASYWVTVRVVLQLQGFDAAPVASVDRYRFTATKQGGRLRLASVTDPDWEARNQVRSQPWDTGPIVVRPGAGVLGVFDPAGVAAAPRLIASVEEGIAAVSAVVPYPWARTAVVYALSDDTFLRSIPELPGNDPDDLDAVAFPVLTETVLAEAAADPGVPVTVASTRLALAPRLLRRGGPGRARLLRHELTHAAIGVGDDHAPTWLREGLAEYASVQVEAPEKRRVQPAALAGAQAGFTELPPDEGFNDGDDSARYGLSWWACEYVASVAGPAAPWMLLDQLEALGAASPQGVADADQQDDVLLTVAGVNARTLARKAGKLLVATFAPPVPVDPLAPAVPGAPVASATP